MGGAKFDSALRFAPLYQTRVWGGRGFASFLGRDLPQGCAIGESWEAVDRTEAQSVVASGPWTGVTLHALWTEHRLEVFGSSWPVSPRFPLLLKLLDARETLSLQVHPSDAACAQRLGESKTEWWYVLDAAPEASVFAGFRPGVDRSMVEGALMTGAFEPLLHKIPVRKGDSLFVPAGRIHAIGAGCLIAEVQQNSDTTFRVFDWNRKGADGVPRELHLDQSLACINFEDFSPSLSADLREQGFSCDFFSISGIALAGVGTAEGFGGSFFFVAEGAVQVGLDLFHRGDWFLLPAQAGSISLSPETEGTFLVRVTASR